jgi:hypothetical protein
MGTVNLFGALRLLKMPGGRPGSGPERPRGNSIFAAFFLARVRSICPLLGLELASILLYLEVLRQDAGLCRKEPRSLETWLWIPLGAPGFTLRTRRDSARLPPCSFSVQSYALIPILASVPRMSIDTGVSNSPS